MTTPAPAGWYGDPAGSTHLRYWDGSTWTEHVTPGHGGGPIDAPRSRLHPAALVAIIVGGVFVAIMVAGMLAAIAIPVFLNQQQQAQAATARADAATLGAEIAAYAVDSGTTPVVSANDGSYVLSSPGNATVTVPIAQGVGLGEFTTDESDFCVSTVISDSSGSSSWFSYSSWAGSQDGACWEQ